MTNKEIDDKAKTVAEAYLNIIIAEAGIILSSPERALLSLKLQSIFLDGMQYNTTTTINLMRGGEKPHGENQ